MRFVEGGRMGYDEKAGLRRGLGEGTLEGGGGGTERGRTRETRQRKLEG